MTRKRYIATSFQLAGKHIFPKQLRAATTFARQVTHSCDLTHGSSSYDELALNRSKEDSGPTGVAVISPEERTARPLEISHSKRGPGYFS
jgi:hypothetical protein